MSAPVAQSTVEITWEDLIRVLEERPEWLARVRRVVLTPELLSLPEAIRELVEAHRRAEVRLSRLEATVQELVEVQRQTTLQIRELQEVQRRHEERLAKAEERLAGVEERLAGVEDRLSRLEATVQELVEVQRRHEERLAKAEERLAKAEERLAGVEERLDRLEATVQELVEVQRQTTLQIQELRNAIRDLSETVRTLSIDMGRMKGFYLEMQYRQKASSYFGRLLRSVQVMVPMDLEDVLEQYLTPEEIGDLIPLDLLVSGRLRHHPQKPEVMLALEVSFTVDEGDIRRARDRALLLRKAGFQAIPAVAGVEVSPEAWDVARTQRVVVFEDGGVFLWDEVIQELIGE